VDLLVDYLVEEKEVGHLFNLCLFLQAQTLLLNWSIGLDVKISCPAYALDHQKHRY
jgi:hypothetical protein